MQTYQYNAWDLGDGISLPLHSTLGGGGGGWGSSSGWVGSQVL